MQRGRKSLEQRAMKVVEAPLPVVARPKPPKGLNRRQAEEWDAIVNRMPADWFGRETFGLLVNLCRHIDYADQLSQELEEVMHGLDSLPQRLRRENPDLEEDELETIYNARLDRRNELARLYTDQSRAIAMCSTKLRVAPGAQDRNHASEIAGKRVMIDRAQEPERQPWEFQH